MRSTSRRIASIILASGLALGGIAIAAPASANVVSAEGGTFDYGIGLTKTWSYYTHPTKKHRSTACNSNSCQRSADAGANIWARADVAASVSGNQAFFYNY